MQRLTQTLPLVVHKRVAWQTQMAAAVNTSGLRPELVRRRSDRDGGHLRHHVTRPANRCVLPQRPGSPARHPTAHLGNDGRENAAAPRHFAALEHLEAAGCAGLNHLASDLERRRAMTNFPYMQVSL